MSCTGWVHGHLELDLLRQNRTRLATMWRVGKVPVLVASVLEALAGVWLRMSIARHSFELQRYYWLPSKNAAVVHKPFQLRAMF